VLLRHPEDRNNIVTDKVVIVTGGSRGIGAEVAKLSGAAGYTVIVNYVGNEKAANQIVSEIEATGGKAFVVQGDVQFENNVFKIFEFAKSKGEIAGLVNNAGVVDKAARLDEMTLDRFNRMFAINITGAFLCAREAVKVMSRRYGGNGGCIVNITSAAAKLGAAGQYVDYAAAKGAIDTMTVGLAREVAEENIRVNAVRPGIIDTDIHASGGEPDRAQELKHVVPMKRPGQAIEVAKAVMWLLSDDSSYSTGAIIDVSGGRSVLP
jgi:NAD(P)-dependent dehydrogenase (short-subunit alcohol dehydrogenase family)